MAESRYLSNDAPDPDAQASMERMLKKHARALNKLSEQAKPEPSVPLSAIRALVQQWREQADAIDARAKQYCYGGELDGDMLDEDISRLFKEATVTRRRADQLAALYPAPSEET